MFVGGAVRGRKSVNNKVGKSLKERAFITEGTVRG